MLGDEILPPTTLVWFVTLRGETSRELIGVIEAGGGTMTLLADRLGAMDSESDWTGDTPRLGGMYIESTLKSVSMVHSYWGENLSFSESCVQTFEFKFTVPYLCEILLLYSLFYLFLWQVFSFCMKVQLLSVSAF